MPFSLPEPAFLSAACALAAAAGAWAGARACALARLQEEQRATLAAANVSVAALTALLDKLINFKKDQVFRAKSDADALDAALSGEDAAAHGDAAVEAGSWPEPHLESGLDHHRLFHCAGADLDIVQLAQMLEYSLAELSHHVRQRNALVARLSRENAQGAGVGAGTLRQYIRHTRLAAQNVDECLFFIDRLLEKLPAAARRVLPRRLRGKVATLGLIREARPLMPGRDFIRGWVK